MAATVFSIALVNDVMRFGFKALTDTVFLAGNTWPVVKVIKSVLVII